MLIEIPVNMHIKSTKKNQTTFIQLQCHTNTMYMYF